MEEKNLNTSHLTDDLVNSYNYNWGLYKLYLILFELNRQDNPEIIFEGKNNNIKITTKEIRQLYQKLISSENAQTEVINNINKSLFNNYSNKEEK